MCVRVSFYTKSVTAQGFCIKYVFPSFVVCSVISLAELKHFKLTRQVLLIYSGVSEGRGPNWNRVVSVFYAAGFEELCLEVFVLVDI